LKRLFLLTIICMVACISCKKGNQTGNERILTKSEVIQGTTFTAGSSIKTKDKGLLSYVTLGADQTVADVNFGKVFPYVFKKGTLLEYQDSIIFEKPEMPSVITVNEKHTIMGVEVPAGTRIKPGVASGTMGGKPVYSVMFVQIEPGDALVIKGKKFNVGDYINIYPNNVFKYFDKGVEKNL
jgi:hypothetical protein